MDFYIKFQELNDKIFNARKYLAAKCRPLFQHIIALLSMIKANKVVQISTEDLINKIDKCNEIEFDKATVRDMYHVLAELSYIVQHDQSTMRNACEDLKIKVKHGLKLNINVNDLTEKAIGNVKSELVPIIYECLMAIEEGGSKKIYSQQLESSVSRIYPEVIVKTAPMTAESFRIKELESQLRVLEARIKELE
jgi:polyhydroxyalkanoate synthesis regulator phasin